MKPRVVFGIIATKWVLAVVIFVHNLFNSNGFTQVAQFGICISKDGSLLNTLMTHIVLVFLACLLTVILNIYLTIKAYQIRKKIEEESKLSGGHSRANDQLNNLHPASPISLWTILQTSQRANDEVTEGDHLPMQMQVSNCCSTATKENKLVKPDLIVHKQTID